MRGLTPTQFRFIYDAISEKVEVARKEWKEHQDEETMHIVENKFAAAERALIDFECWYQNESWR